jgi:hypothetical protein
VIVGTSEVSYGQDYPGTLDFQNDAAHAMTDPDRGQVKGFTVALDQRIGPLIDKIEACFFTSNPNLLSIGHFDGFAFRVTKNLSEDFITELSVLHRENKDDPAPLSDTSVSFGGVYRSGIWTFWGEGIRMIHSAEYPDANYGATLGASRITGPGQVDLEATEIDHTLTQFALGYELFLKKNWAIGPTLRYTFCVGGNSGCSAVRNYGQGPSIGVSIRYAFGGGNANPTGLGLKDRTRVKRLVPPLLRGFHL